MCYSNGVVFVKRYDTTLAREGAMAQPKKHASNAAKQKAYRQRHKDGKRTRKLAAFPVVQLGDCTLYQGDARLILPTLMGIDVVLTDPPYSATTHAGARGVGMRQTHLIDFVAMDTRAAIALVRQCCALAHRWVVMTMDWRHAAAVEAACPALFVREGVWVKPNGAPQFTGDRPGTGWEALVMCHRAGPKTWNGGGHHAVWTIPRVNGEHPTEKPLALMADLVRQFSNPGELV